MLGHVWLTPPLPICSHLTILSYRFLVPGSCGNCWAFSVTSQMESDAIRQGYLTTSDPLSVQQLTSCDSKENEIRGTMANLGDCRFLLLG